MTCPKAELGEHGDQFKRRQKTIFHGFAAPGVCLGPCAPKLSVQECKQAALGG